MPGDVVLFRTSWGWLWIKDIDRLNTNGTRVVNMNVVQPTLEDVFIHLTGKALRD